VGGGAVGGSGWTDWPGDANASLSALFCHLPSICNFNELAFAFAFVSLHFPLSCCIAAAVLLFCLLCTVCLCSSMSGEHLCNICSRRSKDFLVLFLPAESYPFRLCLRRKRISFSISWLSRCAFAEDLIWGAHTHSPTKKATLFFPAAPLPPGNFRRKREKLLQVFKWPLLRLQTWQHSLGQLLTLAHSPHSRSWRLRLAPFFNVHTSVSGLGHRVSQSDSASKTTSSNCKYF